MAEEAQDQRSGEEWLVEQLRLTAFVPVVGEQAQAWWDIVVGEPPDTVTSSPREMKHRFEGSLDEGVFIMQTQFNRVDWLVTPKVNLQEPPEGLLNLGRQEDVLPKFSNRVERWVSADVAPIRLAWGMVLQRPVADRAAGYRELGRLLKTVQIDEESSEFLYQVNRRRMSGVVPDLQINRLQKWTVMLFQTVRLMIGGNSEVAPGGPALSACRLELDINTTADRTDPLPKDRLPALVVELREMGLEIAKSGDIK